MVETTFATEVIARVVSMVFIGLGIYFIYTISKKRIEKGISKRKEAYVCPKCGSLNISMAWHDVKGQRQFKNINHNKNNMRCQDCDYNGMVPLVKLEEIDNFRKDIKGNKKNKQSS